MKLIELVILALGVWRIANLFANEAGPANMFGRIREWAEDHSSYEMDFNKNLEYTKKYDKGSFIDGLSCEWCNSVWFGTITTVLYFFFRTTIVWIYLPLAFSTCAIMIKFAREKLEK